MELQLSISPSNAYSGLISFRMDWFDLLAVQGTQESSPTTQFEKINSLVLSLLYGPPLMSVHNHWYSNSFDDTFNGFIRRYMGFPGASVVKNPSANAGDLGLIPGSGRSLEKEMATHSSIITWEIPWAEEPDGLQFLGLQRVRHD